MNNAALFLHPIAAQATALLDGEGAEMTLSPRAKLALRDELEKLYGRVELALAVQTLMALGAHVCELGAKQAAADLLALACSCAGEIQRMGEGVQHGQQDSVKRQLETFQRFVGAEKRRRAPQFGARPAIGAMRLSSLHVPSVIR